ncbi:hypothetical protein ONZ43_g4016 [Nemania bipapillata]|uniref:Uncharacterized protein n=1 Tax=Nemania bipapillata TaxID=110536 RepID=A0ACC2ISV5_9PEZI|nr:hypothetical protein ONZ43_g4016 [Nemania bipapillata]
MESPASIARGRGRHSSRKRHTSSSAPSSYPGSTTITASEHVEQTPFSTSADNIPSSSFSVEPQSPTASRGTRARARVTEGNLPSSDDLDNKGGRSLRKRARVDYTFDQADEYTSDSSKITPSSARTFKRRRTEAGFHELDNEEECNGAHMKRRSSEQLLPPASALRRRNQARKSTSEPQPILSDQQMEDVEVQDTIEVGGHQSEQSDESTLRRTSSNTSSGFSNDDSKVSHMAASFDSILAPRKSHLGLIQMDQNGVHRNDLEQSKAAHTILSDSPKNSTNAPTKNSYEHLTPYIDNAFVEWPPVRLEVEPTPASQTLQQDAAEETADDQLDAAHPNSFKADRAQEDTPMTEPPLPDSTPGDGPMEETPAISPLPVDTRANSPIGDAEPLYTRPPLKKPISFKKTRDASEFITLFEDYKSLAPEEVWSRLEVVNRALVAWQNEYNELRKITDDEDNAARYRLEELAFEHRVKMLTSKDPNANPIQKDFVVRGIRADRPDPEIAYVRHQDKLMAINYHFDYDDKETKIGYQDPAEQKTGSGKGRLRDRPKQTAKAAEADDSITGPGKRVRKPVALFDGSEAASRGSTPVPIQRRRRRAGHIVEENSESNVAVPTSAETAIEQAPPKKKGKGGRPRKHPLPAPIPEDTPAPAEEVQQQSTQTEEEKSTRKRRRRKTIVDPAEEEEAAPMSSVDQQPAKTGLRRTSSQFPEVPSGSFYASSMQSNNGVDDSRPPTSSSTATHSTVASNNNNYQLREKRQKKFSLNPNDEIYDEEPKPKRVRRSKKAQAADLAAVAVPASIPSPQPPALEPHPTPKPPTKIKLKNYNGHISAPLPLSVPGPNPFSVPSSSNSTPPHSSNGIGNGVVNGTDSADIKDYNQMTKSEKMSHSMKARWASGSMSQAVAKRRATLANKKQAVKAAEPGQQLEAASATAQP